MLPSPWPELRFVEALHRSNFVVARYERPDGRRVIVKSTDVSLPGSTLRLRYEHRILRNLNERVQHAGIVRCFELLEAPTCALVLDDISGCDLHQAAQHGDLDVGGVLHVALAVAETLIWLHGAGVVHKDINPRNIVYNRDTKQVQLIDFGIASELPRQGHTHAPGAGLEGTLAYLSPEQTGRMHFAVDYRTDFYALGATMYEILAGSLPFTEDDPHALLQAILTRIPEPLAERCAHVPRALSDIVARLMAKAPEERYQSAYGIHHDLLRCQELWQQGNQDATFELRKHDRCERFELPQKLYGRDTEVATLTTCYELAAQGARHIVLLRGNSGAGKSALVDALRPLVAQRQGMMVAGKFEDLRRHIPFGAFAQAIGALIHEIVTGDEAEISAWRARVQDAVGNIGQALLEIAPSVALLIGPQPAIAQLPPEQTENRLSTVLQRFVGCLCAERPLALFLDDLQWADAGTLRFLAGFLTDPDRCAGLLIIGAYRSEAVGAEHPLAVLCRSFEAKPEAATFIDVRALGLADLRAMLADCLQRTDCAPLADALHAKTGGNAFFTGELLKHLWTEGLLNFDVERGRWEWDLDAIVGLHVSDDVAAFLTQKLHTLSPPTQTALALAACCGNRVDVSTLAPHAQTTPAAMAEMLWPAAQAGLLLPLGRGNDSVTGFPMTYVFAHDRIHQACYDSLGAEQVEAYHYAIGVALSEAHRDAPPETWIFDVVGHFNRAKARFVDADARKRLADLNFLAGREARRATAYAQSCQYLQNALSMLQGLAGYAELAQEMGTELADSEYLDGQLAAADARLEVLLAHAQGPAARAQLLGRRALVMGATGRHPEACDTLLAALRLLGDDLPAEPSPLQIGLPLLKLYRGIKKTGVAALERLPDTHSPEAITRASLLMHVHKQAFLLSRHMLFALSSVRLGLLTLQHGKTAAFGPALGGAAILIVNAFGDVALALELEELVRRTVDYTNPDVYVAFTGFVTFVAHLHKKPQPLFQDTAQIAQNALQHGNHWFAALLGNIALWIGQYYNLDDCIPVGEQAIAICQRRGDFHTMAFIRGLQQGGACMRGETAGPVSLQAPDFDESAELAESQRTKNTIALISYSMPKLMSGVVHRDLVAARQAVVALEAIDVTKNSGGKSGAATIMFSFMAALSQTQTALGGGAPASRRALRRYLANLRWMAKASPSMYAGLPMLIEAECANLANRRGEAMALYERALPLIEASGYNSYAAVSYECAGRFYARHGAQVPATAHLLRARDLYRAWGARRKVADLDLELGATASRGGSITRSITQSRSVTHTTGAVDPDGDVLAVLRALQEISRGGTVDDVLSKLLTGALSSANADSATLVLNEERGLYVRGQHAMASAAPTLLRQELDEGEPSTPRRMIRYVARTRDSLALNAGDGNNFWDDEYFGKRDVKSVFCTAIVWQDKLLGMLYLENSATRNAFAKERARHVVEVLAMQGAIAIEQANLHANLEERVRANTEALRAAQDKLRRAGEVTLESRMAGGFAHEMRNALSAANLLLDDILRPDTAVSSGDAISAALTDVLDTVEADLPPTKQRVVRSRLVEVATQFENIQRAIEAIDSSTQRAMRVTNLIMDYARLGEERRGADSVRVDDVLARLMSDLSPALQERGIEVELEAQPGCVVAAKEAHIYSIVSNLVLNARDALDAVTETRPRQLQLRLERDDSGVKLSVRDNGIGMSTDVQARLGTPFFTTKGASGTGLGLGTVKKLVGLYGGELKVESSMGTGSTFTVRLAPHARDA